MRCKLQAWILLFGCAVSSSALAQGTAPQNQQSTATQWEALTGFDYFVGRYGGTSDTTIFMVPFNARIQMDRLRLELGTSYMDVKGPGLSAGGGVIIPGSGTVTHRSGLGDTNLGAAWLINRGDLTLPSIEFAGTIKVPTAGNGLGTKKFDYTAQANVYQSISPKFMLLGSIGYQWLGDFNGFTLKDGVVATAGANYKPNDSASIGIIASYRQEYWDSLGSAASLSPYFVYNFGGMWRISGYGLVGLTDASPRWGGGLRIGLYH
jgi:Putative MetA-pathway of phenol degradation